MLAYRALRQLALVLRALQMAASRLAVAASQKAARIGDIAKGAAAFHLARQEDKAQRAFDQAKRNTEAAIEVLLAREDMAEDNLNETLAANAEKRSVIFREII